MLVYAFFYNEINVWFLPYDQFRENIVVRLKNGQFVKIDEAKDRKPLPFYIFPNDMCYFCEKRANVMHELCGYL